MSTDVGSFLWWSHRDAPFVASARGGLVRTSIHGDRVHLTGHAVIVVDGTLTASR